MKRSAQHSTQGFTFIETAFALSIATLVLGALMSGSMSLQKSFAAVDDFFATHMQQIRIIDYLSRDVKRATAVTTSTDRATVTCTIPNYIIQPGDADAGAGNVNAGKRRTPTITNPGNGVQVDYGSTSSTVVYALSGQTILRIENGAVTTVASSTDQLVPETTDVEQANTESTDISVKFSPTFTFDSKSTTAQTQAAKDKREGTAVFAHASLRNKRRG